MAGKINKVAKGLASLAVLLTVFALSLATSAFISGGLLALFSAIWTIFSPLPELLCTKFYLVYIILTGPCWIILVILITVGSSKKKNNNSNRN
jgi:hypothetical protein